MSTAKKDATETPQDRTPTTPASRTDLVTVDKGVHMLVQGKVGRFVIHQEVVAKIIGLAVREVPGVHELVPFGAGERLAHLADRITGHETRDLGVHVEIGTLECAADVRVVCDYGASLPDVAAAIRERVVRRVQEMTSLDVCELNIEVVDLYFDDTQLAAPGRQLR